MPLKLYNTLTREKEEFRPLENAKVRMYTCGPTVYNDVHIGNLRAYLVADVLRRVLLGKYTVTHVVNITDVDDKTIRESRKMEMSLADFTAKYTKNYLAALGALNILSPTHSPKATEYVGEMIKTISALLEKDLAYKADDGVYFRVEKFKDYGRLARLEPDAQKRERIKNDEYDKETAADFALWKFWTEADGEVGWEAPFGKGRPGWHIECSVMSRALLGQPFDIHTGGRDLIFPHHTNEIAQSESLYGAPLARFWTHNEFVTIGGEKMAKSLKNTFTLADIENKNFEPLAYRYLVFLTHYRHPLNFTWEALQASAKTLRRLVNLLADFYEKEGDEGGVISENYRQNFEEAIEDDLNTPKALGIMWEMLKDESIKREDRLITALSFDELLGLDLKDKIGLVLAERESISEEINSLVKEREGLRQREDFTAADKLREKVKTLGWSIEDTEEGPRLRKLN